MRWPFRRRRRRDVIDVQGAFIPRLWAEAMIAHLERDAELTLGPLDPERRQRLKERILEEVRRGH